jgi:hypothetical protein
MNGIDAVAVVIWDENSIVGFMVLGPQTLQHFSKRVNLSKKGALSIQSVQKV